MPVVVACRCGQRFAANEQLIGQQVPCPACGNLLAIGKSVRSAQGIYVSCRCGRAFSAPESLRGRETRCPSCGGVIRVPGKSDRLGGGFPDADEMLDGLDPALPQPRDPEIPWDTLKVMGAIGATVLVLIVAGVSIMNAMKPRAEVAETSAPAAPAAPVKPAEEKTSSAPPRGSSSLPPPPPAPPREEEAPAEKAAVPIASEKTGPAAPIAKLPQGVQDWYTKPGTKLTGIRRVEPNAPADAQFGWQISLLPFLGHQKLHDQFDFERPVTEKRNMIVGAAQIPEFFNPLDDHQRWRGYPFDGLALTHFVGISGVEDARNVVAATLPRTDPRAGIFGYDEVARAADIADGQSQTAMVAGAGALANPWIFGGGAAMRGAREPLFDKTTGLGTKGITGGGSIVVMADGSVRQVTGKVDPKVFKAMCTIRGGETTDIEQEAKSFDIHSLKGP